MELPKPSCAVVYKYDYRNTHHESSKITDWPATGRKGAAPDSLVSRLAGGDAPDQNQRPAAPTRTATFRELAPGSGSGDLGRAGCLVVEQLSQSLRQGVARAGLAMAERPSVQGSQESGASQSLVVSNLGSDVSRPAQGKDATDLVGPRWLSRSAGFGLSRRFLGFLSLGHGARWLGDLGADRNQRSIARDDGSALGAAARPDRALSSLCKALVTGTLVFQGLTASAGSANLEQATACISPAATYHSVNPSILRGILKVESTFNPRAINRNRNGSVDVGIGQMNSIHFKELSKYGIAPNDLFDPCVGTYVAAWHLAKQLRAYGNTWFAIGAYHSATPYFNSRYQSLVYNALIDMKIIDGAKRRVPPMDRGEAPARPTGRSATAPTRGSDLFASFQ